MSVLMSGKTLKWCLCLVHLALLWTHVTCASSQKQAVGQMMSASALRITAAGELPLWSKRSARY